MAAPKLMRVQEKGQVTLPVEIRRRMGIEKGDLVSVEQTSDGILIKPRAVIVKEALDNLGAALREQGYTIDDLEDFSESGREIRGELIREFYGLEPDE